MRFLSNIALSHYSHVAFVCFGLMMGQLELAGAEELTPGKIIPTVTCQTVPGQSYALYLPSSFSPAKKWPLLLCFDAGARGQVPLEIYQDAAEKYGWIVAGSNNARNGPWPDILKAVQALWDDTLNRFPVETQRIYTTGFSGGARVAASIALSRPGRITGVIACGAGLPAGVPPPRDGQFAFCGVAGTEDFNYLELKSLDQTLAMLSYHHRFMTFAGGHDWPPSEVCLQAVEWMEIQAMISGKREKDATIISRVLQKQTEQARALETGGDLLEAGRLWESIGRDFDGLTDIAEAKQAAERIVKNKGYQKAKKSAEKIDAQEREAMSAMGREWAPAIAPGASLPEVGKLMKDLGVDKYRAVSENKKSSKEEVLSAKRLINWVVVACVQESFMIQDKKDDPRQLFFSQIIAYALPENQWAHYRLACAYAGRGQVSQALAALQEAIRKGFNDVQRLSTDPRLEPIRGTPEFGELLKVLKK